MSPYAQILQKHIENNKLHLSSPNVKIQRISDLPSSGVLTSSSTMFKASKESAAEAKDHSRMFTYMLVQRKIIALAKI
jgi:hypothetical protein